MRKRRVDNPLALSFLQEQGELSSVFAPLDVTLFSSVCLTKYCVIECRKGMLVTGMCSSSSLKSIFGMSTNEMLACGGQIEIQCQNIEIRIQTRATRTVAIHVELNKKPIATLLR